MTDKLFAGQLIVDTEAGTVTYDGKPVKVTDREYTTLVYLLQQKGKCVHREVLKALRIKERRPRMHSNLVDVHVKNLRKKLGKDIIKTVPGLGYEIGI